jgi:hypothetical protein
MEWKASRQAMYCTYKVTRNAEARSYNCCSEKAITITYSLCVFVANNAHAPYCQMRPARFYHVFHIIS